MKIKTLLSPRLPRVGVLLNVFAIFAASCRIATAGVYTNTTYGFSFRVPDGWNVTETNFYNAHYSDGVLTVDNTLPGVALPAENDSFLSEIKPGEIYVCFALVNAPFGSMRPDSVAADVHSLLGTNEIRTFSRDGVLFVELNYFKRGQDWQISAALREPHSAENRQKFLSMLESLRFCDTPIGSAAWAESLAWRELPDHIRAENEFVGWPVVNSPGEEPHTGYRSVRVTRNGSGYTVRFMLEAIGSWEYAVAADGTVKARAREVYPISPPQAKLPLDLPGHDIGAPYAFWIDPYVQQCEALGKSTITWYDTIGNVVQQLQLEDGDADQDSGFVGLSVSNRFVIRGLNEDWQVTPRPLPPGPIGADERTTRGTADSRVFIDQFVPEHGKVGLDVYIHGHRVNTLGPFLPCYPSPSVELNEDGSACLLVWKDESKTMAQIVALNSNGAVQFQTDCGRDLMDPIVSPNGAGVLLRPNGTNSNTFMWFTRQGKLHSREINFNPECIGWVPGTRKSLFLTSYGNESNRCALIDWDTGNRLWDIAVPEDARPMAIGLTPDFVILAVEQPARLDSPPQTKDQQQAWTRVFYAVSVEDGKIAAQWRAQLPHRMIGYYFDHFIRLGSKLFFVTAAEFTEINFGDITEKKNGWK
ncbi:MAG TPA: hypothetical protein VN873_19770 [Candidatus Angelobacter sp.]|nr:hypothetical protein [Candidatus Angelobacter sp.]